MQDVIVIGGGPAGMSAALEASKQGAKVLIIERNSALGGILNQCIHNGFGLKYFKEELTGPEYAHRLICAIKENKKIKVKLNTFVTKLEKGKVEITSKNGKELLECKAIILAMGCRERTAGNILLNGTRPSGILTAGACQKLVNCYGVLPGKRAVILGSGDIGLIMARRLTQEGCKVLGVYEINQTTSGLKRNIVQCLEDNNIPLHLGTTIIEVEGSEKVSGVWVAEVDKNFNPKLKTKKFIKCDLVVLSVGLIPETDLLCGNINPKTNSFYVDDTLSKEDGIFMCGNVLHVHDLVDNVTLESFEAGKSAALYALNKAPETSQKVEVKFDDSISYALPNSIVLGGGDSTLRFRVKSKLVNPKIQIITDSGKIIKEQKFLAINSGEMQSITFNKSEIDSPITLKVVK